MTQTAIPAGIGETLGFANEVTPGAYVTPTRWIPHRKAEMKLKKTTAQSEALQGSRFKQASRRVLVSASVDGSVEFDLADKQFGSVLAACIGSTATAIQQGSGPLYVQTHTPGYLEGVALSMQKGVPTIGGAYQAFSYAGTKILDWSIECSRGQIATLSLTTDGFTEVTGTAYTAPSYLSGASVPYLMNFGGGQLLTGGTVTTTSGITTVAGGAAPIGLVSKVSLKGKNTLAQDRFQLGSQVKSEQLTNGFTEITGDVELEFANLADFYTAFAADTALALQVALYGGTTATGTYTKSGLYITLPSIRWEGETPSATGVGVIRVSVPFTALIDSAGDPAIQMAYVSTDTTV